MFFRSFFYFLKNMEKLKYKQIYCNKQTLSNLRNLRTERINRGITQTELSNMLDMTPDLLSNYELGINAPVLSTYIKLAVFFDWNLNKDTNYICYQMACSGKLKSWLQGQRGRYGYIVPEISNRLNVSIQAVEPVFSKRYDRTSWPMVCRVYELFQQERQSEEIREKILTGRKIWRKH